MKRSCAVTLFAVLLASSQAAAQSEERFHSGIVEWTPTLTLRDVGTDSNVYDEPFTPRSDTTATFAPQIRGVVRLTRADVRFGGGADFVYFQRYTSERSVNTTANVRVDMRGWRLRPFGRASILDTRERLNPEIDVRARRTDREVAGGVAIQVSPRGVVELGGTLARSAFREGSMFRAIDLARRMNRESVGGGVRFLYELTPLTRLVGDASTSRDRFIVFPAYDARNVRARAGVEFAPDALLTGQATIGFHRLEPIGELALGFDGLTANVEIGYVLLQRTRVDLRMSRDASYSIEAQPYFLQTVYGIQVLHNLMERVDVFGGMSTETMDYPGIPERLIPEDVLDVKRYGGGAGFRPAIRTRVTFNFEFADRVSQRLPERTYDRRRVFTTVTYGF